VVANGEIWNVDDARRCQQASGCQDLMLGRGMVVNPGLALSIATPGHAGLPWASLLPLMAEFWKLIQTRVEPRHRAGRIKQWLNFLRRHYPEAEEAYGQVRTTNDHALVGQTLFA
jgi:tRNA-dihydrouridine synthase C